METNRRNTEQIISDHVKGLGFIKRSRTWSKETPETITRLRLVKDRWHPRQEYLDIEISVKRLNRDSAGPDWHITGRRFSPKVEEKIEWERCLNLDIVEVSGKQREQRLEEILEQKILPLLRNLETLTGIKGALFEGQLKGFGVRSELQVLLGYSV